MSNYTNPAAWANTPPPYSVGLDETRGILSYSLQNLPDIQPDTRITLAHLALRAGSMLGTQMFPISFYEDEQMGVTAADFRRAAPESVQNGLYIAPTDSRFNTGQQVATTNAAVFERVRSGDLKVPFDIDVRTQPAVAFSAADYSKLLFSPTMLARKMKARTRLANKANTAAEEVQRRVRSSSAQTIERYMGNVETILARYDDEAVLIVSLLRQTHGRLKGRTPQNQFHAANLDARMKAFNTLYYETLETAALANGWSGAQTLGAHKADVKNRYMASSQKDADSAWQQALKVQAYYTNARRFKLLQLLDTYKPHYERDAPYIRENYFAQDGLGAAAA